MLAGVSLRLRMRVAVEDARVAKVDIGRAERARAGGDDEGVGRDSAPRTPGSPTSIVWASMNRARAFSSAHVVALVEAAGALRPACRSRDWRWPAIPERRISHAARRMRRVALLAPRSRDRSACRRALLGIVPQWVQPPPTSVNRSTTATFLPSLPACMAAPSPPGPLPITIRSKCCVSVIKQTPPRQNQRSIQRAHGAASQRSCSSGLFAAWNQLQTDQAIGAADIEQAVRQDRRGPGGILKKPRGPKIERIRLAPLTIITTSATTSYFLGFGAAIAACRPH